MSNAQKTPLAKSLNLFAEKKVRQGIALLGKAFPAHVKAVSGNLVTVNFDVSDLSLPTLTIPIFGPQYIRYPIQVGDLGVVFPVDVAIAYTTGLTSTVGDSSDIGNLAALVWFPISSKLWSATDDPNALVLYGPNGVVMRDSNKRTTQTLTPSGIVTNAQQTFSVTAGTQIPLTVGSSSIQITSSGITISAGGHTIVIGAAGITIDGGIYAVHMHAGVTTGNDPTGPVVPGT